MDHISLNDLCKDARLTTAQAQDLTGKSERQFRRYLTGAAPVPKHVLKLLRFAAGDISIIHPEWSGWMISPGSGALVSPSNKIYTREWLLRLHFHFQMLRDERSEMRTKIRRLKKQVREQKYSAKYNEDIALIDNYKTANDGEY